MKAIDVLRQMIDEIDEIIDSSHCPSDFGLEDFITNNGCKKWRKCQKCWEHAIENLE